VNPPSPRNLPSAGAAPLRARHVPGPAPARKPITLTTLAKMKRAREKFAVLTAYDASFAALLEAAGVDVILVGDSLGMVIQGQHTTVPVTLDDMIYHTRGGAWQLD
jgi:3-methyl-2-oxobutanoate hydroxymethyltransferase